MTAKLSHRLRKLVPKWTNLQKLRRIIGPRTAYAGFLFPALFAINGSKMGGDYLVMPEVALSAGVFLLADRLFFAFYPDDLLSDENRQFDKLAERASSAQKLIEALIAIGELQKKHMGLYLSNLPIRKDISEALPELTRGLEIKSDIHGIVEVLQRQLTTYSQKILDESNLPLRLSLSALYFISLLTVIIQTSKVLNSISKTVLALLS